MGRNTFLPEAAGGGLLGIYSVTTAGTHRYTAPAGTRSLLVYLTGGGGGGGAGSDDYNAGGGGAAGGTGVKLIANPASQYDVEIGAGGTGAEHYPTNPGNGSAGANSKLITTSGTVIMQVPYGNAGTRASGGTDPYRGGEAIDRGNGLWYGCNAEIPGGDGGPGGGGYTSDNCGSGGHGGGSWWCGHGGPVGARDSATANIGIEGGAPGCGGGGGQEMGNTTGSSAGGNGAAGGVIIYAYG